MQSCAPKTGICDTTIDRLKICCCNTEKCNDAAFGEKRKAGTAPTSQPKGFTCFAKQPGAQSTNYQECSSMFKLSPLLYLLDFAKSEYYSIVKIFVRKDVICAEY